MEGAALEEQEDLVARVSLARNLMHRVVSLQEHMNELSTQYAEAKEKRKKRPILYAVGGFLVAFWLVTSTPLRMVTGLLTVPFYNGDYDASVRLLNIVNLIVSAIVGVVLYRAIAAAADKNLERMNAAIDQNNAQVETNNQSVTQGIEQTKENIFAAQQRWATEVAPWYPVDYQSVDAVDFFYSAVRNHRATTVQEMVNLYETEMHQRRMEQGQQAMINQQSIGNMLQLGNLFMQGQILNQAQQINTSTASTSKNLDWITWKMGKR